MPRPTPLAVLVTVEERIQTSKGLCGLDQHQVRRWRSWYRWMTLALLATPSWSWPPLPTTPATPGLISLTCNQLQHLFAALLARPAADPAHRLRWSLWRRRQQARACHYHRQANRP